MSETDSTERLGINAVGVLAEKAGWVMRELPRPDHGIDVQLERRRDGRPDGQLIGVQVKSGATRFRNPIPGGWRFYVKRRHIQYWNSYAVPVLLVLYHPVEDKAYWQVVNADTAVETRKEMAVDVPSAQVFDASAGPQLDIVTQSQSATDGLRDRRAALDLPWMWMLHTGQRLVLEVEQRLDPPDGRCVLRLVGIDGSAVSVVRTWPWTFLPGDDFAAKLADLFPWANKTVDVPWYRKHVVTEFLSAHATWLPEHECYEFDASFDDWFSERFGSSLVPYATPADGGVALWRLELTLNDAGIAAVDNEKDELMADAWADDDDVMSPSGGSYAIDFIDPCYPPTGFDTLVYRYEDEDEDEGIETLLIEAASSLTDSDGRPTPGTVATILRHAGADPTETMTSAFLGRFAYEFDRPDGPWEIERDAVSEWIDELQSIAKYGAEPE